MAKRNQYNYATARMSNIDVRHQDLIRVDDPVNETLLDSEKLTDECYAWATLKNLPEPSDEDVRNCKLAEVRIKQMVMPFMRSIARYWFGREFKKRYRKPIDREKNGIIISFEVTIHDPTEPNPDDPPVIARRKRCGLNIHVHIFFMGKVEWDTIHEAFPHAGDIRPPYKHGTAKNARDYVKKVGKYEEPNPDRENRFTHVCDYEEGVVPEGLDEGQDVFSEINELIEAGLDKVHIEATDYTYSMPVYRSYIENRYTTYHMVKNLGSYDYTEPCAGENHRECVYHYGDSASGKTFDINRLRKTYGSDKVGILGPWNVKRDSHADSYFCEPHVVYEELPYYFPGLVNELKRVMQDEPYMYSARYKDRPCAARGKDAVTITCRTSPVLWLALRTPENKPFRHIIEEALEKEKPLDGNILAEFDSHATETVYEFLRRFSRVVYHFVKDWSLPVSDPERYGQVSTDDMIEFYCHPDMLERRAAEMGRTSFKDYIAQCMVGSSRPILPERPAPDDLDRCAVVLRELCDSLREACEGDPAKPCMFLPGTSEFEAIRTYASTFYNYVNRNGIGLIPLFLSTTYELAHAKADSGISPDNVAYESNGRLYGLAGALTSVAEYVRKNQEE